MASIATPLSALTREFWHNVSHTTDANLGKAILMFLVFAESIVCMFWIYTLSGLGEGYALMAAVPYAYIIVSYVSLLIFYRTQKFEYFTFTQLVMLLVMPFFMQWAIGGYAASSGIAIWAILSPIGALMILGTRQSTPWFMLFTFLAIMSYKLNHLFAGNSLPIPMHIKDTFFLLNIMGTACILYAVMRYFQTQKERILTELNLEQQRSEKLLLNILPKSIASRLKANDMRIADSHDAVTILFADIVDFTKLTASMHPAELVDLLSQLFSRFDLLTEKLNIEKIKNIGDGYMAVSGAPICNDNHASDIAELAIKMHEELLIFNELTGKNLQMRIGISSGSVVAGVIGTAKFAYDIWGDSVNMASRMESSCLPGQIQVSESSNRLLAAHYQLECRGLMPIKGKENVNTYWLKQALNAIA